MEEENQLLAGLDPTKKAKLIDHVANLRQKFTARRKRWNEKLLLPPTPTSRDIKNLEEEVEENLQTKVLIQDDFSSVDPNADLPFVKRHFKQLFLDSIHPQSGLMTFLYVTQAIFLLYNAWVIPLRFSFTIYQTSENTLYWLIGDYISDIIYWLDLILFKPREMYLDEAGSYVSDKKLTARHYVTKGDFKTDLIASIPTDVLYIFTGVSGRSAIFRINRIAKNYVFSRAFDRLDAGSAYPTVVRLVRTVNIMLYLIHLNACAYYAFSSLEGIGSNKFVYSGIGSAYIRCFYFATKTAMSIGKNPKPATENTMEIIFMATSWLMGVFVFAVLIGNVKGRMFYEKVHDVLYP